MKMGETQKAQKLLEEKGYKVTPPESVSNKGWLDVSDVLEGYEVEIEVHDKDNSWDDLKLSEKEDQLLTAEQCIILANSKYAKQLKIDGSSSEDDFFIKQPFNLNKKNNYVARFGSYSGCSILGCWNYSDGSYSYLGVRFCRKISKEKKQ